GVVVCRTAEVASVIPLPLLLAILLHGGGVLFPVPLPVIRIPISPLPWALHANLSILRIGSDLAPVVIVPPLPLAIGIAAYSLRRLVFSGLECLLAIQAAPSGHESRCPTHCCLTAIRTCNLETVVECLPRPRPGCGYCC